MREKRRYVMFRVISEKPAAPEDVRRAVTNEILSYLGTKGCAEIGYQFMDYGGKEGIIRVNNTGVDRAIQALTLLKEISFNKAFVHIIKVTGTIKKARNLAERGD